MQNSSLLTGHAIKAGGVVQLVGEGEQLAEELVGSLGERHAAGGRLARQQAVLPRVLARLVVSWGEFLYQGSFDGTQVAPCGQKKGCIISSHKSDSSCLI